MLLQTVNFTGYRLIRRTLVKDLRLNKIAFNPKDLQKVLVYPLKNMSPPPEKYGSTPLREYGSTSEKYGSYPLKNNYGSTP